MDPAEKERLIRRHLPGAAVLTSDLWVVSTDELIPLIVTYRQMFGLPPVPPVVVRPDG